MKYSKTKLDRSVVSLKSLAQYTISDGAPQEEDNITRHTAEDIMIVLDRLSKLELMAAQVNPTFKFAGDNK